MTLDIKKRRALYVYLRQIRHASQLKKFGELYYVSRQMKFAMIYVNDDDVEQQIQKIKQYKFVRDVIVSPRPDINPDLDNMHDDIFFENYDEGNAG